MYTVSHLTGPEGGIAVRRFEYLAVALIDAVMHPGMTDALVSFMENGKPHVLITDPREALAKGIARFVQGTGDAPITRTVYPDYKPDDPEYGLIIGYSSQAPAMSDHKMREAAVLMVALANHRKPHIVYTSTSMVCDWIRVACIELAYDFRKIIIVTEAGQCIRLNKYGAEVNQPDWQVNHRADAAEIIVRNASRISKMERHTNRFTNGTRILFVSGQWQGKTGTYVGLNETGPGLAYMTLHKVILDNDPCQFCLIADPACMRPI